MIKITKSDNKIRVMLKIGQQKMWTWFNSVEYQMDTYEIRFFDDGHIKASVELPERLFKKIKKDIDTVLNYNSTP